MKIREVLSLYKMRLIPQYLVDGYYGKPGADLAGRVTDDLHASIFCAVVGWLFFFGTIVFWLISRYDQEVADKNGFRGMAYLCIFEGVLVSCIGLMAKSSAGKFGDDLNMLRLFLNLDWKTMLTTEEVLLRGTAESKIFDLAGHVRKAEIQYGINSPEADLARITLKSGHAICFKFKLVEEKYNKYYREAEQLDWVKTATPLYQTTVSSS